MKYLFLLFFSAFSFSLAQTTEDSIQFKRISDEILINGEAYENLRELTKDIGHRLSGTENLNEAIRWAAQKMEEAGADTVWLQEVMVPVWERGKESLQMKTGDGSWEDLKFLSLGNSEGSSGKDLIAEVIMVRDFEELESLPDEKVKGKAVFINYPFRQDFVQTFRAYGDAAKYRWGAASKVAEKGGKFAIVRSLSSADDDAPHTGAMGYDEKFPKIPAVTIGNLTSERLALLLQNNTVTLKLNSECGMKGEALSYNVIGEIKGQKDDKIISVGGHIDSWDVGEGAHDDGAGIVQGIEILRAFKALGIKPNHTIRAVGWTNEENGVRGGVKYAEEAQRKKETHLFAIESDAGGFVPRGISLDMDEESRKQIQSWAPLFLPYGVYDFSGVYGGVDINPLNRTMGVPVAGLSPDSQRYFDLHHSENDTFDKVNKRELHLGAIAMGQIIFMIDKYWD